MAVAIAQGELRPLAPADVTEQVHADLVQMPSVERQYARYLTLYATPAAERPKAIQAISGFVNCISREVALKPPAIVPGTQGALLRVSLLHYEWDAGTWDKLADPYLTKTVEVETKTSRVPWEGGTWPGDGRYYPRGAFEVERKGKKERRPAFAPWLLEKERGDPAADKREKMLLEIGAYTRSKMSVVKAEWFVGQLAIQRKRPVGYYDFLQVKDQKDFDALVRFDVKLSAKLEHRRVTILSDIAVDKARRLERTDSVKGGRWQTFDNEKAIGDRNPIKVLDGTFKFDATEIIAPLANGMPAFFLGNDKGVRQDVAPPEIVGYDRTARGLDGSVHIFKSCVGCHFAEKKEECGVKKAVFAKPTRFASKYDPKVIVELERQYLREIEPEIEGDRLRYIRAIKQATGGMEPFEWANELLKLIARYEGDVTPERAAADLGVTRAAMVKAFRDYDAKADLDPVLSVLMEGGAIGITQWEDAINAAHLALRGYRTWPEELLKGYQQP